MTQRSKNDAVKVKPLGCYLYSFKLAAVRGLTTSKIILLCMLLHHCSSKRYRSSYHIYDT